MALDQSDLLAQLKLTGVTYRIRLATETLYQELIDVDATEITDASSFGRSLERTPTQWHEAPDVDYWRGRPGVEDPEVTAGSFFPALLERCHRVDQALFAVVMKASVHGLSPRAGDDWVRGLGADTGISQSEVSCACSGLDAEVAEFHDRTVAARGYPSVFLGAIYCKKAGVGRRIVSQTIVVAVRAAADGRRRVLDFDFGTSENEGFWTGFLWSLKTRRPEDPKTRRLEGVKLVMSDARTGMKKAVGTLCQGASWQRYRVHSRRNVLAVAVKGLQKMVASIIRTIFAQPDEERVLTQFDEVTTMLICAEADPIAFAAFPCQHRLQM